MKALESETGGEEAAARTAADNFYLCLKENEPQALCCRLGKLAEAINGFNRQAAKPYRLILQPGAYMVEDPAADITVLQDRAKTASRNRSAAEDEHCKFYDAAFTQRLLRERELNDLFEPSLENGDFQVFLQPKVGVNNDEIGGAEALVRWIHSGAGSDFPLGFYSALRKERAGFAAWICTCSSRCAKPCVIGRIEAGRYCRFLSTCPGSISGATTPCARSKPSRAGTPLPRAGSSWS